MIEIYNPIVKIHKNDISYELIEGITWHLHGDYVILDFFKVRTNKELKDIINNLPMKCSVYVRFIIADEYDGFHQKYAEKINLKDGLKEKLGI